MKISQRNKELKEKNVRNKPADWGVTRQEVSPYKDVYAFPKKDMFSFCAGSVQ